VTGLSGADLDDSPGRGPTATRTRRVLAGSCLFVVGFSAVFVRDTRHGHIGLGLTFLGLVPGMQRDLRLGQPKAHPRRRPRPVRHRRPRGAGARRHTRLVMGTGGSLLVIIGLLQVTGTWGDLIARLQGIVGSLQTVV